MAQTWNKCIKWSQSLLPGTHIYRHLKIKVIKENCLELRQCSTLSCTHHGWKSFQFLEFSGQTVLCSILKMIMFFILKAGVLYFSGQSFWHLHALSSLPRPTTEIHGWDHRNLAWVWCSTCHHLSHQERHRSQDHSRWICPLWFEFPI